jgi:purine-cytosine permease-like protein
MNMPKSIAAWCTVLFFLWFGLAQFIPALTAGPLAYVLGILALGAGVFTLLGK